jgi:hypothetical protein
VAHDNLAGQTVTHRYDLLSLLGRGGMGEVYRAHDRELDELVAFKVINPERARDPIAIERFRREVKLARRVTHRNIARTFELGHDRGITYCTMELVEGEPLAHRIKRGKLPVHEAAAIAHALCEGLAAAHAAGVIHRDIKPSNVLLAVDRPVIADFGIAAVYSDGGQIAGTPGYMAPEQARGEPPTPASDIYAVGVVLFEMLTGGRAFTGASSHVLAEKQEIPALQLPDDGETPRELAHVIARATARDPARRIGSATEMAAMLSRWVHSGVAIAPGTSLRVDQFALREVIVLPPQGEEPLMHIAIAVHEAVLDRLAKTPRVRVMPRVQRGERADAIVELHVTRELEVRIVRSSGTLRLQLPLTVDELGSASDAIAAAVTAACEQSRISIDAQHAEAIDLWLRARAHSHRNMADVEPVIALLERAKVFAPHDPKITASLAIARARQTFFRREADDTTLGHAVELIKSALAIGVDDPEVHIAAALLELNTGEAAVAATHYRAAIACSPFAAEAHEGLGRMLIEAKYLEAGLARLEDASAISPDLATGGWMIARMHALENRWDDCAAEMERARLVGGRRPSFDLRFALWRGDLAALAGMRETYTNEARAFQGEVADGVFAAVLDGTWPTWRDKLVALATTPTRNRRRNAFMCQIVAEAAGAVGDRASCEAMIVHAVNAGLFDLHWLDACPPLALVRGEPLFQQLRARVVRRAEAILDALYGDQDSANLSDTVVG